MTMWMMSGKYPVVKFCFNLQRTPRKSKKKKPAAGTAADDEALAEASCANPGRYYHTNRWPLTQESSCFKLR